MSVVRSFPVPALGVGRVDYSENVEVGVEPLIRSWESEYRHREDIAVAGGGSTQVEIAIVADTVVILYDFFLSTPRNVLLHMTLEWYDAGPPPTWAIFAEKSGYQNVELHLERGVPLFDRYRVTVVNPSPLALATVFSAHGIVTAEESYWGRYV